jgi:energy-coupling factor transporter ATP-binding protein EcfA2
MDSPDEIVLKLEDYSFWYVGPAAEGQSTVETLVLDDVNLEVRRGEFVLLLGPTSSGKTTLFLTIVGVLPGMLGGRARGNLLLHDGTALVSRKDIPRQQRFVAANMVFQDPNDQLVALTVEDEIAFALENYQVPREQIETRIDEALEVVGLTGFRPRSVTELSGGEKQRVAIAAMLALQPRILLLDQPTSNLDPLGRLEVLRAIDEVRRRLDIAILIAEQATDSIFETVDRVLLLADKTIQFSGTPRELIERYGLELRARFGLWMPQAPEVGLRLRELGLAVDRIPLSREEVVTCLLQAGLGEEAVLPVQTDRGREKGRGDGGEPVLSVRNLSFSYPSRDNVLRDISFDVYQGETVAILGQNGSGKTTLISHLPGILKPTEGDVFVRGMSTHSATIQELASEVAFVFQYPDRQFITHSVEAELAHGLKAMGTPKGQIGPIVERFLRQIDLWDLRTEHPYSLSHGQKRRLSVACMQIMNPAVIVLDEPTFGLDWLQVTTLMDYLYQLTQEEGTTTLFVTHDMQLVARYAQRAIVLHDSQLVFDGPPPELFAATEVLNRTSLQAPPVWTFSAEVLGSGVLRPEDLCALVEPAVHGRILQ